MSFNLAEMVKSLFTSEMTGEKTNGRMRWLIPLFLAILLVALVWFLSRGGGGGDDDTSTMTDTASAAKDTTTNMAPVSIKVKLPDGAELDAYKGGIEDQLVNYLNSIDPGDSISKGRWFDFDNLNFKAGSNVLTAESHRQLQNIAAILKAYPKVKIRIGGYTDKTGREQENRKLSQRRADAVVAALKNRGADPGQLVGAEGYGSRFARAATDAPDAERKPDRRISINVREK